MSSVRSALPAIVLAMCAIALVPLQRAIDANAPATGASPDEVFFEQGDRVKLMALGYDSLLADVYWMRAIQFFGRQVIANQDILSAPRGRLDTLYPLIDVSTTLDPHNVPPYRFGGYFVHDYVDKARGRQLLEKGVRNNPNDFRLYQDLAYLTWTNGDCDTASRLYAEGGALAGAPVWMKELSAIIHTKCGHADLALEMLRRQYDETEDPRIRTELAEQLASLQAQLEVTFLRQAVDRYRAFFGRAPASLAQLLRSMDLRQGAPPLRLDSTGAPLDPKGVPYAYDAASGAVNTDPKSMPSVDRANGQPGTAGR